MPDQDLVRRTASGEARALEELYSRYGKIVYALARKMLADQHATEEVVQDAFFRVWKHANGFSSEKGRFSSWLLSIAHNLAVEHLRRGASRPALAPTGGVAAGEAWDVERDAAAALDAHSVEDVVWASERRGIVRAALNTLPEAQRQALEMAYYGGYSQRQIAEAQQAPLSTVKTRLALGLSKVGEFLRAQGLAAEELL